ncbi:MAG: T9SS type A sorting domain-containing protein [Bacteroidetes bacterium]|nr:T9SS type A sorting domain-containing protein [Bacteroidota bacterium]
MPARRLLIILAFLAGLGAAAQPQWRFHLAFEDGTGARDTLWLIYDVSATHSTELEVLVDTALGEGRQELSPDRFHVFTLNALGDTTQTSAIPYTYFPRHAMTNIGAFNWELPMTIRWDTSLFHAPYLPDTDGGIGVARMDGEYFFFFNNHPLMHAYDMLMDDSVVVSDDHGYLFPIYLMLGPDDGNGIGVEERAGSSPALQACYDPAAGSLILHGLPGNSAVEVFDLLGHRVAYAAGLGTGAALVLPGLSPGIYSVRASTRDRRVHHAKFFVP